MAFAHVDPSGGTDSTGRGSVASPYASIQYAHNDSASWADGAASATEPNVIYLWNTAADVLTATIAITMATIDAPLIIEGYDGGGSLTCTLPFGNTGLCGEIDGNDAISSIFSNEAYMTLRNIKAHSTTSYCVWLSSAGTLENSHIYNGASRSAYLSIDGTARNSFIDHDVFTVGQYALFISGNVFDCETKGGDGGIFLAGGANIAERTLVHGSDSFGIIIGQDNQQIRGCTIDGTGTSSGAKGVSQNAGTSEGGNVLDCLITNWSNTASYAIQDTSGAPLKTVGNNFFWNNTNDESYTHTPNQRAADTVLGVDPYTDSATDDYSLVTGSAAIDAALFSNPDLANPLNAGAYQDLSSGGGGGGEPFHVSAS
jgi:hypothetical protein